ncbi:uncharacterized protein LOC122238548 isoform X2 [Panthera tigris]|uniref:uncharacterized protein LOC122238548 isoform X2 n=1 Tax=Panthera tigris TaxID=9694 RepID=UPI001C6F71F0|nr:uncharacterized protein LOC122238548 isoform X2 [Panthera tigris]
MKLDLMKAGRNQGQMGWRNCHPRCTLKPDAVSPCGENQFWGAHSPEVWGERRTPPCLGGGSSLLPSDKILSVDDSRRQVRRLRARWLSSWHGPATILGTMEANIRQIFSTFRRQTVGDGKILTLLLHTMPDSREFHLHSLEQVWMLRKSWRYRRETVATERKGLQRRGTLRDPLGC